MKAIETKIFHGEIHQHFRERNLTDSDEKEKLSVLIKDMPYLFVKSSVALNLS